MIMEINWRLYRHYSKNHLIDTDSWDSDHRVACGYKFPRFAETTPFDPRAFTKKRDCQRCRRMLEKGEIIAVAERG